VEKNRKETNVEEQRNVKGHHGKYLSIIEQGQDHSVPQRVYEMPE
jgi:hypothetical protein